MMCGRRADTGCGAPLLPGCPVWCMVLFLPAMAWHPLRDGLPSRTPATAAVAEIIRMHEQGDLTKMRGLGPRRLTAIQQCLPASPAADRHDPQR
jgi:hypothetical protein